MDGGALKCTRKTIRKGHEKRIAKAEYHAEEKQKRAVVKTVSNDRRSFHPFNPPAGGGTSLPPIRRCM